MRKTLLILIILVIIFSPLMAEAKKESPSLAVSRERLQSKGLSDAILGALAYLEDTQIRNRPGRGHPSCDSTEEGDGAKNEISLNLPFRENILIPVPPKLKVKNRSGEWSSYVHFLPKRTGFGGRNLFSVPDSNLFMTAFIGFPLFFFDDSRLPSEKQFIARILPLAMENIQSFKRDNAFNFWATLPGVFGKAVRTGPFNIPVEFVGKLGKAFINPKFEKFFALLTRGQKAPPKYWVEQCLDSKLNSTGADSLFNIPNDADDTSTAVAFQTLFAKRFPQSGIKPDFEALKVVCRFRDVNRDKEDGRDIWKGKSSGAFLTWLKDERNPTFESPEIGIVPLGVNNVDCVVNANIAFALALTGRKKVPGYKECLSLLVKAVSQHAWPEAGLYYPQYMIFPYTVSRAWRDGGARDGEMGKAMEILLRNLLDEQDSWGKQKNVQFGAFPGGEDRSDHLATALGLCAMLNIGRTTAEKIGIAERYDRGVMASVQYLCKNSKSRCPVYSTTKAVFSQPDFTIKSWVSGLFFAASFWDLAHWRSEAFTVAIVLEALTKYALGYDRDLSRIGNKKLFLILDSVTGKDIKILPE